MKTIPNKDVIINFYLQTNKSNFKELSNSRMLELDNAVEKWRYFFDSYSCGLMSLMTFAAEKMYTSNGRYGAITNAEKLYFYIKMVDPNFYFLEVYESANTMDELKELCFKNFRFYDPILIKFEKRLYRQLGLSIDDFWSLNRIKR